MWFFNLIFGKIFEIMFFPLRSLSPWFAMAFISCLTGIFMLLIFRLASNQEGIKRTKSRVKAHLLELRLFRDSLPVSLQAQGNLLLANFRYIGFAVKPMLVMLIPLVLTLAQLDLWFGRESLQPGRAFLLKARFDDAQNYSSPDMVLETPSGLEVETPPLRLEEQHEVNWRLRARERGVHALTLKIGEQTFVKKIAVAQPPLARLSPLKVKSSFVAEILNPGERPLPSSSTLRSIEVVYPARRLSLFGLRLHWLIAYFVLSVAFGFVLKKKLGVEI